jgi:tryptophanyl-tRNA synthetase
VECKKRLASNLNLHLEPFRTRRAELDQRPDDVWEVLYDGARRARTIAEATMVEVRAAIGLAEKKE